MEKARIMKIIGVSLMVLGILIIIISIKKTYFQPHNNLNVTYQQQVCNNLEKVINDTTYIYPEIVNVKTLIETDLGFIVTNINGRNISARMWNSEGVSCQFEAEICRPDYLYCLDIKMLVPINYTEWEMWQ